MNTNACAFTGHNPLRFKFGYDEDDPLCIDIKQKMFLQILALYESGVADFLTDCEIGAGMWGAELVIDLMQKHSEIHLTCVLPHEEQAKKWTPELRNRYYTILEKSSQNILISAHYVKDCFTHCGQYLVNHASFLIAIYDNSDITNIDVASRTIAYARKKGRRIIYIHPDTSKVTTINTKET